MEALEMRRQGHTYDEIANTLGMLNARAAGFAVRTAMERRDHRMDMHVDEIRRQEQQRLEMLVTEAFGILQSTHVVTSGGNVVIHNGNVLIDHGPTLAAIETLRKLSESRRKMLGLDAATKLASEVSVKYTIEGISEDEMP